MNFKDAEIPNGVVDGANKTFFLAETRDAGRSAWEWVRERHTAPLSRPPKTCRARLS